MKKQTISALLTALMICLTIAIVVLIIKIETRQPVIEEASGPVDVYEEEDVSANAISPTAETTEEESVTILVAVPNASSSVNVRSGPGTDYSRIGSAYSNNEYEVIEVLSSGWTKISYSDQEAYINSEYVVYQYRTTNSEGLVTYDEVSASELGNYKATQITTSQE